MNKRSAHKQEIINALNEAQRIAFAPLTFQAAAAMIDLGILKEIDNEPVSSSDLTVKTGLTNYTVKTLLELAETAGIIRYQDNLYSITPIGQALLYDEMTRVNFNFTKDVCYKGAARLTDSFKNGKPEGLKELYPEAKTIYPYISKLPEKMRKSWYEFDHYYSDNCFDIIYKIISPVEKIFDIGANTGKFERVCLKHNPDQDITMLDLAENINFIKNNPELQKCKFYSIDVLDEKQGFPKLSGAVFMSQFLDCFSEEQIVFILKKIAKAAEPGTKIYILEPFIDKQKFSGAKYSLVHTSLYFTCMANGCSKMYTQEDMENAVLKAGLKVDCVYDALGAHDYTLLECIADE